MCLQRREKDYELYRLFIPALLCPCDGDIFYLSQEDPMVLASCDQPFVPFKLGDQSSTSDSTDDAHRMGGRAVDLPEGCDKRESESREEDADSLCGFVVDSSCLCEVSEIFTHLERTSPIDIICNKSVSKGNKPDVSSSWVLLSDQCRNHSGASGDLLLYPLPDRIYG